MCTHAVCMQTVSGLDVREQYWSQAHEIVLKLIVADPTQQAAQISQSWYRREGL